MQRKSYHPLVVTIIGLAILGLGYQLITSPGAFITRMLMMVGVVVVLFFLVTRFIMPRIAGNVSSHGQTDKKYAQAQRAQQKARKRTATPHQKSEMKSKKRTSRPLVKRQPDVKLTVIEGKKNKRKNRA